MNVAIFGGSFNPIHVGHAIMAEMAGAQEGVDEVWLMVSPQNPFKVDSRLAPEDERLAMSRLVAQDCTNVKASDFEFALPRPSYTYDTLRALQDAYPQHHFMIVIGSDNWLVFDKWRDSDKIISEFGVLVYQRPDAPANPETMPPNVRVIENVPQVLVSSTMIRQMLKENKNVNFLVPPKVLNYIRIHKLYKE